jgi:hypothetical protein
MRYDSESIEYVLIEIYISIEPYMQKQGAWMPNGVGSSQVSDEHLNLLGPFVAETIESNPGYLFNGKATYVKMVYDTRYICFVS